MLQSTWLFMFIHVCSCLYMFVHVASITHIKCFGWLRLRLRELWTTERLNLPTRCCCCCCRRHCCCYCRRRCCCWRRCCWCCYLRCCCWRCCYCCYCLRCYFYLCCCWRRCCWRRCFCTCVVYRFVSSVRFGCSRTEQLVAFIYRVNIWINYKSLWNFVDHQHTCEQVWKAAIGDNTMQIKWWLKA